MSGQKLLFLLLSKLYPALKKTCLPDDILNKSVKPGEGLTDLPILPIKGCKNLA